jgi:hypothetical protein
MLLVGHLAPISPFTETIFRFLYRLRAQALVFLDTPHDKHVLDLVLEHVPRHPEIPLVFTGEEDRLLEQVQVFHPERGMGPVRRAVTIASTSLVRPSVISHLLLVRARHWSGTGHLRRPDPPEAELP